jgi:hypothetical protein
LPRAKWSIQGYDFITDLKVIPLPYYDLIIGIDWLKLHSPMQIHRLHKWMKINNQGTCVHLQGLLPPLPAVMKPPKNEGFVASRSIGGFSMKRERANTHTKDTKT